MFRNNLKRTLNFMMYICINTQLIIMMFHKYMFNRKYYII